MSASGEPLTPLRESENPRVQQTVSSRSSPMPPKHFSQSSLFVVDTLAEPGMTRVPVEIKLTIFESLDMMSAFSLAISTKTLKTLYDAHRAAILLSILAVELSPFDDLLQFVTAKPEDLDIPLGHCLRRKIFHNGKQLSKGETEIPGGPRCALLGPVTLGEEHFSRVMQLFRVIKGWERLFPRYRFNNASDCRPLRAHEAKRLRAALYRWMRYAYYFHGDLPRPNRWIPQKFSADPRCRHLRALSDAELHELEDLWKTARVVVVQEICPSTELVLKEMDWSISKAEAAKLGFGSSARGLIRGSFNWNESTFVDFDINVNASIVDTFLKLPPGDILRLAKNRSTYSRDSLIREVRLANPYILDDRQSLGHALSAVLEEREEVRTEASATFGDRPAHIVSPSDQLCRTDYSGGILDHVEVNDEALREAWGGNGERALSWNFDEEIEPSLRIVMSRGRLES